MSSKLESYLQALPDGLASYPQCQTKASSFRSFTDYMIEASGRGFLAELPQEVRDLVDRPPEFSAWVPSVHWNLLLAAYLDASSKSDQEVLQWYYDSQLNFFTSKVYAPLFKVMTPAIILRGAKSRFSNFHTAVDVSVERWTNKNFDVRLAFPDHLLPDWRLELIGVSIRAALDVGGHDAGVYLREHDAGGALFSATIGSLGESVAPSEAGQL